MASPIIKILTVSNVYCRLMEFVNKGDVMIGHHHTYDHGTLVSSGEVLVEMLGDDDSVISSKVFKAPTFIFIAKEKRHRITSLEDNTIAVCIHAIRDAQGTLLSPDFIIDERQFEPRFHTEGQENFFSFVQNKLGAPISPFTLKPSKK